MEFEERLSYLTMTTPRSVEFNEMVARFYVSIEVLIGEFEETVIGFRKLGVENEFLKKILRHKSWLLKVKFFPSLPLLK